MRDVLGFLGLLVVAAGVGCGAPSEGRDSTGGGGGTLADRLVTSTGPMPNRSSGGESSEGTKSDCRALGADCFDAPTSCRPGSQCVRDDEQPSVGVCTAECISDADCPDGCCLDFGLT